ncbi:MAG: imelysin family protein, partial [Pseudomonadota bacterium]
GNKYRCDYLMAVSTNLKTIALELVEGWKPGGETEKIWTTPGPENAVLRSDREAINEVLGTLVHGLEAVRDLRIGVFLRKEAAKDRPRVAILRRSDNSLPMIIGNIAAAEKMLNTSQIATLVDGTGLSALDRILFDLQNARKALSAIDVPIAEALQDPQSRQKIVYAGTAVGFAIKTADQDFATAAGLSSGFSFSDGD